MKKLYFVFIIILTIFSCKGKVNENDVIISNEVETNHDNDTIKTPSGLQYYYIKKGKGAKITEGSYVKAYSRLYLNDVDTVFWSTDNFKDSVFVWIHGKTGLIKGGQELYPLLSEGDHVVAIMPDSIGYGEKGNANVPGGATLIFNPIIIKSVSEPKEIISDTLIAALDDRGLEQMISVYNSIVESELKDNYHFLEPSFDPLVEKLWEDKKFEILEEVCLRLKGPTTSALSGYFDLVRATALKEQGKYQEAISLVESLLEKGVEQIEWANFLLKNLKELKKTSNSC